MNKPWYQQWFWEGVFGLFGALFGGISGWMGRGRREQKQYPGNDE